MNRRGVFKSFFAFTGAKTLCFEAKDPVIRPLKLSNSRLDAMRKAEQLTPDKGFLISEKSA